jgi:hypothetical protein
MSAAPRHHPPSTTGTPGSSPLLGRAPILPASPCASRSFVLAACALRALHLDPLVDRRPHKPAARREKNDQADPLSPAPVFIERTGRVPPSHSRASTASGSYPLRVGQGRVPLTCQG